MAALEEPHLGGGGRRVGDGGSRPICSICYEDFKPITEDLQSISVCGHVFHELCIQQWLEYCPAGKKPTCPVCKQKYCQKDLVRLYFQSAGDAVETQKPFSEAEAEVLRVDSRKLKERILVVTAAFDDQKKRIWELNEEVSMWKEMAKKEEALKEACRREKEVIHQLLQAKREELSRISEECARLKERSLALAKELAAIKLATDVNLGEEEMVKFASVGRGSGHTEIIDVLKKSLVLRNKSYKELMAQCTLLGRAETRAVKKLEKSEERIKKLKARLQEMEKLLEEKDNGILRNLKASNKTMANCVNVDGIKYSDRPCTDVCTSEIQTRAPVKFADKSSQSGFLTPFTSQEKDHDTEKISFLTASSLEQKDNAPEPRKKSLPFDSMKNDAIGIDLETDGCFFSIDKDKQEFSPNASSKSAPITDDQCPSQLCEDIITFQRFSRERKDAFNKEDSICLPFGSDSHIINIKDDLDRKQEGTIHKQNSESAALDDFDNGSLLPIRKVSSTHETSLAGSEGGKRPGKWCRHGQSKVFPTTQTSANTGGLIVVGADGRGGKIKVLRAPDQCLDKGQQHPKRHKYEVKQPGISQGCLQIEHFFTKK